MSEELNTKSKCQKTLVVGVILSLVFSFLALCTSVVGILGQLGKIEVLSAGQNLPISKKYDRGQSWAKALKKKKPVVVFFYADWCGYCQRFAPTYNEVAKSKDIKKKFAIAYVNCDDQANSALVSEYGVQGFPTVFVVNPETKEKIQLENNKFFSPTAKEDMIRDIKEFLRKK